MQNYIVRMLVIMTIFLGCSNTYSLGHTAYAWGTNRTATYEEDGNTHLWILNRSVELLKRNEPEEIPTSELEYIEKWKKELEKGAHHADWQRSCNSYYSYGNHYYNPDTRRSFIPTSTAKDDGVSYFEKAGAEFQKGNLEEAFYNLGLSLHFAMDMTQPMHTVLFTDFNVGMPAYHELYERHAMKIQNQFPITEKITIDVEGKDPGNMIEEAARTSFSEGPQIINNELRRWLWKSFFSKEYDNKWKEAVTPLIGEQLKRAQILTAQLIHLWFKTYVLTQECC